MSLCRKCGCELGEMDDCCPGCLAPVDKRKASTMALLGLRYEPEPKLTPPDAEPQINPEWVKSLEAERDALRHVAQWLAAGTYRTLCHRHDGTFVAGDESERLMMRADTIPLLSDSLLNWPKGAEALPPAHFIKVQP